MTNENLNLTVFGRETEFDGVLEFTDNLVITGKFYGTIKATGNLEVEKNAVCDVDKIEASSIIVSGEIKGNLIGKENVELCTGSRVTGNIETSRLRIADNVEFEGSVNMLEKEPETDLFSVASAEYKESLILKIDEAH